MKILLISILLPFIRRTVPFSIPSRTARVVLKAVTTDNPIQNEKLTPEAMEFQNRLADKKGALFIAQTAPSVRVALPEEFGMEPGSLSSGIMVSAMKELGFDKVIDTNIMADLTICEEATELLNRVLLRVERSGQNETQYPPVSDAPLPLFTSCCPGWLFGLEKMAPDLAPYISSCKSPHMMLGALVKEYSKEWYGRDDPKDIYLVSIMPCVKKRPESDEKVFQHGDVREIDNVLTTRDVGQLLRMRNIDPTKLEPQNFDSMFQEEDTDNLGSGAGQLFGSTGGVMEAAVRTVYAWLTGKQMPRLELTAVRGLDAVKEATVSLLDKETGKGLDTEIRVAVVNGLGNAKKLIQAMKNGEAQYDFIEVMACIGGCIGGGGQPRSKDKDILQRRQEVIYKLDRMLPIRQSHENPSIKYLYEKYLGEIGGEKAHHLLHVKPIYGSSDDLMP